jgi:hypothetical protein
VSNQLSNVKSEIMNYKVYTGAHLLAYSNKSGQFGIIDAWANTNDFIPTCRIHFGKHLIKRIKKEEETVNIELTMEEADILVEELKAVIERIKTLTSLAKQNKLTDSAYYSIEDGIINGDIK